MRSSKPPAPTSPFRRVGVAAMIAMSLGLVVLVVGQGFSSIGVVRALEDIALGVLLAAVLMGAVAFVAVRMAGWRDPESESEFDEIVRNAELLARQGLAVDPEEDEFIGAGPARRRDFEELVARRPRRPPRPAPQRPRPRCRGDLRRRTPPGRLRPLQGDGATRDHHHDRIVIFRDTLRRDFGHDPDLLRDQVDATVRHELAHHVGFDELGVSRLDL